MNPFASLTVSDPIPLPFDEGQWIQVRRLTGREITRAQEAHRDTLATGDPRLWAASFKRMLATGGATDPEVMQAITDPLTGYDRYALVRAGLVAWSYPQVITVRPVTAAVKAADGAPSIDAIEDLDDDAVDFIATEVLRRTKPALFLTAEEDVQTAQKELQVAAPAA